MNYARLQIDRAPGALCYRLELPGRDGTSIEEFRHAISDEAFADAMTEAGALLRDSESSGFVDRAASVGSRLYRNLMPGWLRDQLADLRLPILLVTTLQEFPFELFHDGREFLGLRFAVGRRVVTRSGRRLQSGERSPRNDRLDVLVIGSNPRGDLPFVEHEAEAVHSRLSESLGQTADTGLLLTSPAAGQAPLDDVSRRFAQGISLLHYCGHVERRADGSVGLLLADERLLSIDDIANNLQGEPVVFINACASTGRIDQASTGGGQGDLATVVGGFVRGGARAVIGTLSDVSDTHAAILAQEFYRLTTTGASLGEALRRARAHCREHSPDSRTWLSFVLYGNPTDTLTRAATSPGVANDGTMLRPSVVPRGLRAFGAVDAPFFLTLVPGTVGPDGLPDSVRFWKDRIESGDPELSFRVGLVYGPSGCGKSSLLRAGLVPRLGERVVSVCVNAASEGTEMRLSRALRRKFKALRDDMSLRQMVTALREDPAIDGSVKVLLVIDQFEQWLHANRANVEATELTEALFEVDGKNVCCLLLVRDDYWTATVRLFRAIDVPMQQDRNCQLVDLFDRDHARRVLHAFGAAYGRLPADAHVLSAEQCGFLDEAIAELETDGRVVCVRLSLLAEMLKDRSWDIGTLAAAGGAEGLGVRFFDQAFNSRSAIFEHRALGRAARKVLGRMLPAPGDDINTETPSWDELRVASGLDDVKLFDRLLEILDGELRVIAPTEGATREPWRATEVREQSGSAEQHDLADRPEGASSGCYQLTHDYLVPALREWLTNDERRTFSGRARGELREHARRWGRGGARQADLPPWAGTVRVLIGTSPRDATAVDRTMLRLASTHRFAVRALACLLAWPVVSMSVGTAVAMVSYGVEDWRHSGTTPFAAGMLLLAGAVGTTAYVPGVFLARSLALWVLWVGWLLNIATMLRPIVAGTLVGLALVGGGTLGSAGVRWLVADFEKSQKVIDCDEPSRAMLELALGTLTAGVGGSIADETVSLAESLRHCPDQALSNAAGELLWLAHRLPLGPDALGSIVEQHVEGSPSTLLAKRALDELQLMKEQAAPALSGLTNALVGKPDVAPEIATTLGEIGPAARGAIPALLESLRQDDPNLRARAAEAVGKIGYVDEAVLSGLRDALRDGVPAVRSGAAMAVGLLGMQAKTLLRPIERGLHDSDDAVRCSAAVALLTLDPSSVPALEIVLQAVAEGGDIDCRARAREGLAKIGPRSARLVPALVRALSRDDTRVLAVAALGRIGPRASVAAATLRSLAKADPDAGVRLSAGLALWRVSTDMAPLVHVVLDHVDGGDAMQEASVLRTIGDLGPTGARHMPQAFMQRVMEGKLPEKPVAVQTAAAIALWRLTGEVNETTEVLSGLIRRHRADDLDAADLIRVTRAVVELGPAATSLAPLLEEVAVRRDLFGCRTVQQALRQLGHHGPTNAWYFCLRSLRVDNNMGAKSAEALDVDAQTARSEGSS